MNDTTLLSMLNAARALHERDTYGCVTCMDSMGNNTQWPCPTATALGATGRTEWTTPPNTTHGTVTDGYPHMLTQHPCGTIRTEPDNACDADDLERYSCTRDTNHDGKHRDVDGDTW